VCSEAAAARRDSARFRCGRGEIHCCSCLIRGRRTLLYQTLGEGHPHRLALFLKGHDIRLVVLVLEGLNSCHFFSVEQLGLLLGALPPEFLGSHAQFLERCFLGVELAGGVLPFSVLFGLGGVELLFLFIDELVGGDLAFGEGILPH
jgi:hypothetical protein